MFGEIESGGRYAVGQQDAEFLTAKATEDIALAQVSPACEDCVLQHLIAHGMPVCIVDLLEVVQIDQDQADRAVASFRLPQDIGGFFDEMLTVENAGQAI